MFWANIAFCQIQTTGIHENIFSIIDTFGVSTLDNKSITVPKKITNGIWDYSAFNTSLDDSFVNKNITANTPGATYFPTATSYMQILSWNAIKNVIVYDSMLTFYSNSGNGIKNLGYYDESKSKILYKCTPKITATFPLAYTKTYNQTNICSTKGIESYSETEDLVYDGYGKVKFPGETTYTDVARFTSMLISNDTLLIPKNAPDFYQYTYSKDSIIILSNADNSKILSFEYISDDITDNYGMFNNGPTPSFSVTYMRNIGLRDIMAGIENNESLAKYFSVYPNPTNGKISFQNADEIESVELIDLAGKSIKKFNQLNEIVIDNESGLYILKITDKKGRVAISKITKE